MVGPNVFGAVDSGDSAQATGVTRLAEPERDGPRGDSEATAAPKSDVEPKPDVEPKSDGEERAVPDRGADADRDAIADRIRDRGERVRRRELETALVRLRASGEVTPAERRVLAALSARITDRLVERWASRLDDDEVDPEAALALLSE